MKQLRRRLEHKWRKNLRDYNWIAVRVATNLYLFKVKAASQVHLANQISEASYEQAELFRIVCNLSAIGPSDGLPLVFHQTNMQHF